MREDRNQFQIIRKDARNCFVESLNDSFSIGRIHLAFAAYDQSKPAGQRQTNNVHIYIAVDEFLELCRKLDCGELRYILQSKKKNGDNTPLYQCLGGTSAEKLRAIGRARPDGKSLSRVAQLVPANKADFLFVADSGPGETNEKGLIVPKFGNKPENHVAVMMSFESLSEMFLITRMQMRNFLLRGPAGTGKTMGAKAIAAGLGLPYMKYTCSANTEIFDFVGMIFPDSADGSTGSAQLDAERETLMQMGGINYANVSKLMKLPDLDDMDYDPAGVYMALTGVENAAATSQDCMSIVLDSVTEKVRELSRTVEDKSSSGQTYRYVETDFIKALKHGYVIEIQEPSTIVQPGVLVGLNSLLEQSGSITLPTGEVIQRHPDAVVVVTTNTSYEGCRGMNQSVLDRMSLIRDVELPSPEVMAQRAMSVTGATDEYEVSKMVQVVNDLAEYCRKNSITDGSYGMRSLIDWIISSEITGDVYESALYTIISKATADELDREALISTVLEPIFAPKRHKASA